MDEDFLKYFNDEQIQTLKTGTTRLKYYTLTTLLELLNLDSSVSYSKSKYKLESNRGFIWDPILNAYVKLPTKQERLKQKASNYEMDDFGNVVSANGSVYKVVAPDDKIEDPKESIAEQLKRYYTEPTYDIELQMFIDYVMNNMKPKEEGGKLYKDNDVLCMDVYHNAVFDGYESNFRNDIIKYILKNTKKITAELQSLTGFSEVNIIDRGIMLELVFTF